MFEHVFSSLNLGSWSVKNRLAMAPMGSNYADARGLVTEKMIGYYLARAQGGVGMVTIEGAYSEPRGRVLTNQLALDDDIVIPGLAGLISKLHGAGTRVVVQILHGGRQTKGSICGGQPVAPSPIPCPVIREMPHELNGAEISGIVENFSRAAERAFLAGTDGVELHAAHGYLLNQFLSPYSNHRQDQYGGSPENRIHLVTDIVTAIRAKMGSQAVIGCRLSASEFVKDGLTLADSQQIAVTLELAGVNYLSISGGIYETLHRMIPPMDIPAGSLVYLSRGIKETVKIPVACVGGFTMPDHMEAVLANGDADFILLGRALLADPDLAAKMAANREDSIRPCILCNNCRRRDLRPEINCTVNYQTGRETQVHVQKALVSKRIVVIGGGPAGMEAARVASERGHRVTLFEQDKSLGGQLNLARVPPGKQALSRLTMYMEQALADLDVEIRLGERVTPESLAKLEAEALILATGAKPRLPVIKGLDRIATFSAWQVLKDYISCDLGYRVLIVGGGLVGIEVAEFLGTKGKDVIVVEVRSDVLFDTEPGIRSAMLERIRSSDEKIRLLTSTSVIEVANRSTVVANAAGEERLIKRLDAVILAVGAEPQRELWAAAAVFQEILRGRGRRTASQLTGSHP